MIDLGNVLRDVIDDVQQENKEAPDEATAPGSLFDKLRKIAQEKAKRRQAQQKSEEQVGEDVLGDLFKEVDKEQKRNESSRTEPTAAPDIFVSIKERADKAVRKETRVHKKKRGESDKDWKKRKSERKSQQKDFQKEKKEFRKKIAELTREFQKKRTEMRREFKKKMAEKYGRDVADL